MVREFNLGMVNEVLQVLSNKVHMFVSEIHLQTEFIICANKLFPECIFYPELVPSKVPKRYREKYRDKGIHFDLLIRTNSQKVLIEFKYITNGFKGDSYGMRSEVKSHMALDVRRYDCWRDIERIETFVLSNETDIDYGYFILITNVQGLWIQSDKTSFDREFSISEGDKLHEIKNWDERASLGTKKGREQPLEIKQDYSFGYNEFYDYKQRNGLFKSLVVEIKNKG